MPSSNVSRRVIQSRLRRTLCRVFDSFGKLTSSIGISPAVSTAVVLKQSVFQTGGPAVTTSIRWHSDNPEDQFPNLDAGARILGDELLKRRTKSLLERFENSAEQDRGSDTWWFDGQAPVDKYIYLILDMEELTSEGFFDLWKAIHVARGGGYMPFAIEDRLLTTSLEKFMPGMKTQQLLYMLLNCTIPSAETLRQLNIELGSRLGVVETEVEKDVTDDMIKSKDGAFGREVITDSNTAASLAVAVLVGFSQQHHRIAGIHHFLSAVDPQRLGHVELCALVLAIANLSAQSGVNVSMLAREKMSLQTAVETPSGNDEQQRQKQHSPIQNDLVDVIFSKLSERVSDLEGRHVANVLVAMATLDKFPTNFVCRLEKIILREMNSYSCSYADDDLETILWSLCALEYFPKVLMQKLVLRVFGLNGNVDLDGTLEGAAATAVKSGIASRMQGVGSNGDIENQLNQVLLSLKDKPEIISPDVWKALYSPDDLDGELDSRISSSNGSSNVESSEKSGDPTSETSGTTPSTTDRLSLRQDLKAITSKVLSSHYAGMKFESSTGVRVGDADFYSADLKITAEGAENLCFVFGNRGEIMDPWQRLKIQHLQKAGYRVVKIPSTDWARATEEEKMECIKENLGIEATNKTSLENGA